MISSMTGFGRGASITNDKKIQIEIKSVNSKQLDIITRFPSHFKEMELSVRNFLSLQLGRGKVEVWATIENLSENRTLDLNYKLMESYKLQMQNLGEKLNLGEPQDWYTLLLRLPDVLHSDSADMSEDEGNAMMTAVEAATRELILFRKSEGEKLYNFFISKIHRLEELLQEVGKYENERIIKIRERLEEQLEKLSSIEYDKGRLEQEMIYYIEKLDVTEEKVRLQSHINYFIETLDTENSESKEGVGKKLGFIAQEMGREINTLGSKSNHAEMQKIVVKMKDELEQIKEQVLNVL